MSEDAFVIASRNQTTMKEVLHSLKFLKAGAREHVFFDPKNVRAAIVTCGGLCPGLNVVIREIVMSLHYNYEAKDIWGVKWGYKGFYSGDDSWVRLEPKVIKNIHKLGGTILGSSRGGFDADKILNGLIERGINQVYVIGGDGTHRGCNALIQRALERKVMISFVGIPKTIDNDIPLIDSSFGFNTSCEVAARMIEAAYVEATNAQNGVGLVKLMGRYSGFIARNAALANGNVDICLVPELTFELGGPLGLYEAILQRVREQGHCVVVVAEGAEEGLINPNEHITKNPRKDDSNNIIFDDIGKFLKEAIVKHAKDAHGISLTLKNIIMLCTVPLLGINLLRLLGRDSAQLGLLDPRDHPDQGGHQPHEHIRPHLAVPDVPEPPATHSQRGVRADRQRIRNAAGQGEEGGTRQANQWDALRKGAIFLYHAQCRARHR